MRNELRGPPRPGQVWARGAWRWDGARYVWYEGRWLAAQPGYTWLDGHWANQGGAWVFVEGAWVPSGAPVAGVAGQGPAGAPQPGQPGPGGAGASGTPATPTLPLVQAGPVDPQSIPFGLLECDASQCDQGNRGVWIFHGQTGEARWPEGANATLSVERFDAGGVIIRRTDTPNSSSPGLSALYQGALRNGKYEGTVDAVWPGHFPKGTPAGTFHSSWFATVPQTQCDQGAGMSAVNAMETGQNAVQFQKMTAGFQCFMIAAKQGDGQAKSLVGLMYRDGIGVEVNYAEAQRWLRVSAIQGEYNAQFALMQIYEIGIGVPADPQQAAKWRHQAEQNPMMVRARQQAQQRQQMQQLMFMGFAAVLEAAFRPSVYVVSPR